MKKHLFLASGHVINSPLKWNLSQIQSQAWYRQSELTPVTPGNLAATGSPAAGGSNGKRLAGCRDISFWNFKVSSRNKFQGCIKVSLYTQPTLYYHQFKKSPRLAHCTLLLPFAKEERETHNSIPGTYYAFLCLSDFVLYFCEGKYGRNGNYWIMRFRDYLRIYCHTFSSLLQSLMETWLYFYCHLSSHGG